MIVEFAQWVDFFVNGNIHFLMFFLLAVMFFYVVVGRKARRYVPYVDDFVVKTTTIIPVYGEDFDRFKRCVESVRGQTEQLIVVVDGGDEDVLAFARLKADLVFVNECRVGKRKSVNSVLGFVKNPVLVLMDSDVIVECDALRELVKPFVYPFVGLVQGHPSIIKEDGGLVEVYSSLIESTRDVACRALNGHLVVADGKCLAVRTELFKGLQGKWVGERWLGRESVIGDDRATTRLVHGLGYSSVYQSTAFSSTFAPDGFFCLLRQQLRWLRSGYKYFFKDVWGGNMPSMMYGFKAFFYYLSPLFFVVCVLLDVFFTEGSLFYVDAWVMLLVFLAGVSLLTFFRQFFYFGFRGVREKYLLFFALMGLFVMFPLMLYAVVTNYKQDCWLTRRV
jgi:cellulose synthase/poly-beta-1,6-N-acetylglucosamine synthase-like glycosyltransferase